MTPLRVVSLFSGVGGFDLGLERAGMVTVAQVEWDKKCQQVLAHHWPDVPRWGDVSDVRGADLPDCDVVAFGSPCQDLSVAGKRAGMVAGETRSGLFFEAIRIIKELQNDGRGPAWAIWENVVGALSSNNGHDFAAVLDSLGELGALALCWRVLDAQWFGTTERPIPQRRRRVFVVACFDSGVAGGEPVLPLGARLPRDFEAGNEAGSGTSEGVDGGAHRGGGVVAGDGELVTALTGGLGSGGPDAAHGQARWLIPESDAPERERERDDSRSAGDGGNSVTGRASGRSERSGRLQRSDHPDVPRITGTVTTTWAKGAGNTQVEEGLVIPVKKRACDD